MSYYDYAYEILHQRLDLDWPLPYLWALTNGLDALRKAAEFSLSVGRPNAKEHIGGPFLSGFLCRSWKREDWYWLLMPGHYDALADEPQHLRAFRNIGIGRDLGMVNALQRRILAAEIVEQGGFADQGGVFNTLPISKMLRDKRYPKRLGKAEKYCWPIDEFIGMSLLGVIELGPMGLKPRPEHTDLRTLPDRAAAFVFVFCVGTEPLEPGRVTRAFTLVSEVKRFFWHFLQENAPRLNEFADALTRSAVAAVMARNMSHNIGSHVSPRTMLPKIQERLAKLPTTRSGTHLDLDAEQSLAVIRTLRDRLDKYIQQKADFLAEITTEPLTTTKPVRFYREAVLPFVTNTLLMDTLAANEGFVYRTIQDPGVLIRVRCNGFDVSAEFGETADDAALGISYHYPKHLPYTLFPLCATAFKDEEILYPYLTKTASGPFDDIDVELPGPLGEYALFALLENIIRNSAKHNSDLMSGSKRRLEITLSVIDTKDPEFYDVEVYDNVSDPRRMVSVDDAEWADVRGNARRPDTLALHLWEHLDHLARRSLVEPDGRIRRSAWGVGEMRICATLLGGSAEFLTKAGLSVAPTTTATPGARLKGALVYRFRLMKPKKVCALVRRQPDEQHNKALKQAGIWLFSDADSLKRALSSKSESAASFRFCVIDCTDCKPDDCHKLLAIEHQLPFRRIATCGRCENGLSDSIQKRTLLAAGDGPKWTWDPSVIEHWCWRIWCRRYLGGDGAGTAHVDVAWQQKRSDRPTAQWDDAAKHFEAMEANSHVHLRVGFRGDTQLAPPEPPGPRLFYDRHGDMMRYSGFAGDFLGVHACVLVEKNNPDFSKLFDPGFPRDPKEKAVWTLPYQLAEAGMLRVAVIDERLAETSLRSLDDDTSLKLAYSQTGHARVFDIPPGESGEVPQPNPSVWHVAFASKVFLGTHISVDLGGRLYEGALHRASYEECACRARVARSKTALPYFELNISDTGIRFRWSTDRIRNGPVHDNSEFIDALIIHFGILEAVERKTQKSATEILKLLSKHVPFVIVDSGRGIPPTLPKTAKFLPFSLLQDYVGESRTAKFSLAQVVMSLARRHDGNADSTEAVPDHSDYDGLR